MFQKKLISTPFFLLLGVFLNFFTAEAGTPRVAALLSYSMSQFNETLEGFKRYFNEKGFLLEFTRFDLDGDPTKADLVIQEIKRSKPGLILTLGSLATNKAAKEIVDIPIIGGVVLRAEDLKMGPNVTGVFLEHPPETQFEWLRRFIPNSKNIGVLYNPRENGQRIRAAARVAEKMGFNLKTREIHVPRDLPMAMESLANETDALWGIADKTVFAPETTKQIFLFSFRNKIPFIGLSSIWTKSGALYSLGWDYKDLGMQCGEMAFKALQGVQPSTVPPASPRKVAYSLNLKTAEHMKVDISEPLVREAQEVY